MDLFSPMLEKRATVKSPRDTLPCPVEIPFLQFPGLSRVEGLRHAVYTRLGGSSRPPYESLNISSLVGDDADRVAENRQRIQQAFGAPRLQEMNQVHGDRILVLKHKQDEPSQCKAPAVDAAVTTLPGVALMVKQADCQAIVLVERARKAVAVVHCGWRGNVVNLPARVVEEMRFSMGCSPAGMRAAIGPSLGPCCAEFTSYETLFPEHFRRFLVGKNHFDFWEISRMQLIEAGLPKDGIEIAGICTRCRTDLFFSYRGEKTTGRFATLAMLEP